MDNPTRSIADQVAALESAREAAEDEVTTLKDALAKVRDFLTAVLDGRAEAQDFEPAAEQSETAPTPPAPTPDPRLSREESKRRNDAIDKAVLSVLAEVHGEELSVATLAGRLVAEGMAVDSRGVSMSLQRILKAPRVGWNLIPGKKGRWRAEAKLETSQPAENGTHAEHHVAEEPVAPEDDASALEEAGVVAGGADPADYGWR
jgi:hypothetical protein